MRPRLDELTPRQAICSKCLGAQDIAADVLVRACEGRQVSTVYASDELAFPGVGLPKLSQHCSTCGQVTVPIAVPAGVAEELARRGL